VTRKRWQVLDIAGRPEYVFDLNSGKPLPFANDSVDNVYCSHTLEHVHPDLVPWVLSEMVRSLVPGGKVRVVVPDIRIPTQRYMMGDMDWLTAQQGKAVAKHNYPPTALGHYMLWWVSRAKGGGRSGHNTAFDAETLMYYLGRAGFSDAKLVKYGKASKEFLGLDFKRYAKDSIYVEAQK